MVIKVVRDYFIFLVGIMSIMVRTPQYNFEMLFSIYKISNNFL